MKSQRLGSGELLVRKLRKQPDSRMLAQSLIIVVAFTFAHSVLATESAQGQNYAVVHSFAGGSDGATPAAGLVKGPAGNIYGTTYLGGTSGDGTVFELNGREKESVLYSFKGGTDGAMPVAGLVLDAAGDLYGTTTIGGDFYGTIYKLDNTGNETVLYSFTGLADGGRPQAALVFDTAGNLYGTTFSGGDSNFGTVFKLDTSGNETVLHSFTATGGDGADPYAGLVADAKGNLYGTTFGGGVYGAGTVFKVAINGDTTTLYSFTGGKDGAGPVAGLIRDSAGNLYGTTLRGGDQSVMCDGYVGCGTVFELTESGDEIVLYSFTGGNDGASPAAGLIRDPAGTLYGTTQFGGALPCSGPGCGTVFRLATNGKETVLHTFAGGADGSNSEAGLLLKGGALYGTTPVGGASDSGTLFKFQMNTTTITLSSSPNPSIEGESVTFTAVVTSTAGPPPNGETVTFMQGTKVLGMRRLSKGSARFITSSLRVGTDDVTALYGGDSNFIGSASKVVKQVVNKN
jgi:uncharacterized repeat protein (TIGR03803 family)